MGPSKRTRSPHPEEGVPFAQTWNSAWDTREVLRQATSGRGWARPGRGEVTPGDAVGVGRGRNE